MEIHFDEKTIVLDDYKKIKCYGCNVKEISSAHSKKGHIEELTNLFEYLTDSSRGWPIEFEELIQTTLATFMIK